MSFVLNRLFRYAARRVVFAPRARNAVVGLVRSAAGEAKLIAGDQDKARAAGRSVRRALNRLRSDREDPETAGR
jgi:hypothetical protein